MPTRTSYTPGTFCWTELSTSDAAGAKSFYSEVLGWEPNDLPIGEGQTYTMLKVGGADVAALQERREQSIPPHWLNYVAVDDADTVTARARELGATVHAGPFDVTQAGRMSVLGDPQGATFALWQAGEHAGAARVNEPGALSWNDLQTTDVAAARSFYSELFGWTIAETEGAGGQYFSVHNGDAVNGGMMPMPPPVAAQGTPPYWMAYFAVDDLDAAVARATAHGGTALMQPMDVPAGRFAPVRDPQGAVFSLYAGQLDP